MSYFLIILVVFIALSPLITMRPSKQQLKLARLREAAAINGLQVQMRKSPLESEGAANLVLYSLRRPRNDDLLPKRLCLHYVEGEWAPLDGLCPAALEPVLQALPAGCDFLLAEPVSVGVILNEQGDTSDVDQIAGALKALFS